MKKIKYLLIFTIMFSMSCSKGGDLSRDTKTNNNNPIENGDGSEKNPAVQYPTTTMEDELRLFPKIAQIINNNNCMQSKTCTTKIVESGNAPLKDEQILVFEQIGVPWSSFLRYKDRISGFYTISETGNYKRHSPNAKVSVPVLETMDYLNNLGSPVSKLIPSLGRYLYSHSQVEILNPLEGRVEAHSRIVFELMVDKNPDANFVFADAPQVSVAELCGSLNSDNELHLQKIQDKFDTALAELSTILRSNKIKYINASFVSTPEVIAQNMYQACHASEFKAAKQIFEIKSTFLKQLLIRNPDVILVQAVPNDNHDDYDCTFDRRWIRVGYTTIPNSNISSDGIAIEDEYLPYNMRPVKSCMTLAINGGITDKTEFESILPKYFDNNSAYFNYGGLYAYPVDAMATSWATPLALSFIRANSKNKNPNFIYTLFIDRIFDPLKNKQFIENK